MSDTNDKGDKPKRAKTIGRVRMNFSLSEATHKALKVWCAQKGVTIQAGLERVIDRAFRDKKEVAGE